MGFAYSRLDWIGVPSDRGDWAASSASVAAIANIIWSAAQLVDLCLKRGELRPQLVDFATARPVFVLPFAREGPARVFEHRHVALGHVGEHVAAECVLDCALVALERLHRRFEI